MIRRWMALAVWGAVALPAAAQAADGWRLVAAYDATAIAQAGSDDNTFLWRSRPGMQDSCGEAKRPDGLGIFEAEAVATGLSPALVLMLAHDGEEAPPLTASQVRVSLGRGDDRILLQPMVEPRFLAFRFPGLPGEHQARWRKLVQTQLSVQACLEHKVGRGWLGAEYEQLRQAWLLDPPPFEQPSRRFFGGQAEPVPALRGAPDACFDIPPEDWGDALPSSRGAGAFGLQPSDVWGASLRPCPVRPVPPDAETMLPLSLFGDAATVEPSRAWQTVQIDFTAPEARDGDDRRVQDAAVRVRIGPPEGEAFYEGPLMEPLPQGDALGMIDVLARVPYRYPTLGVEGDDTRYTALVIPDWQLVEALRRLNRRAGDPGAGEVTAPMGTDPGDLVDGVGTVLLHPELLFVQVDDGRQTDAGWPNLAVVLQGRVGTAPYGYAVDVRSARSPIAVARAAAPSWWQVAWAQRAHVQATLYAALVFLAVAFAMGLARVRDLWTPVPRERASYWPGVGEVVISEAPTANTVEDAAPPQGGGL